MKFAIIAVGRVRGAVAEVVREYETRAARYWPLVVNEVREESARSLPADLVREREGDRLLEGLDARAHVVACDVDGERWSSEELAAWMQRERERATGDVGFVIGGALGLSDAVRQRSRTRLSLSPFTLPHELARLVLAEQLYRAGTIIRGEPYHK